MTSRQNIGNAGEYYTAAQLSAKNFITTITLGRAERYDIIAIASSGKTYKISVKARLLSNNKDFQLSEKDEKDPAEDFYYIFVRLNLFEQEPDFWVVPSIRVSKIISDYHKEWLDTPNREGGEHHDSSIRKFCIYKPSKAVNSFPDNWEEEVAGYYKNLDQLV